MGAQEWAEPRTAPHFYLTDATPWNLSGLSEGARADEAASSVKARQASTGRCALAAHVRARSPVGGWR